VQASWPAVAGTGGTTHYSWTLSPGGATGTTDGLSASVAGLGAGSYTISVTASNDGGKVSGAGTSNAVSITTQGVPPAPGAPSTNVTDGTATGSITWTWGGVTASPGGTANLTYQISVNGGGWIDVGAATSYSGSYGAGDYTARVQATNKSGSSAPSGASANGHIESAPYAGNIHHTPGSGPATRNNGNGPVTNTYKISFDVSNFPAGTYTVSTSSNFGYIGSWSVNIPANGTVDVPSGWCQSGPNSYVTVDIAGYGQIGPTQF
jgi:hypothetical protein